MCAIVDMVVTTLEQSTIIQDQNMMALFSMPIDQLQLKEAHEYFRFRK
jgi:hypothetical protein